MTPKGHALPYQYIPLLNWINISVLLISLFDLGISIYIFIGCICVFQKIVLLLYFQILNNVFFASTWSVVNIPQERIGTESNIYQYSSRYKRDLEMSYIEFFLCFLYIIKC